MSYTLLLDGNWHAQRILRALNLTFTENPEADRRKYIEVLSQSFSSILGKFDGAINHVLVARDYGSWRKHVDTVKPKELMLTDDDVADYKANRKAESTIDWTKVYSAFDDWCNAIEQHYQVPVVRVKGAEGDDVICIVSKLLDKAKFKTLIVASDGDFKQSVTDNIILYRYPKEHAFISKTLHEQLNSTDEYAIFTGRQHDVLHKIISAASDVHTVNGTANLLDKIIKGDGKDNVAPLFQWKTAKTKPKPNNTHIKKSYAAMNMLSTDLTPQHLYDDKFIKTLITHLFTYSKQTRDLDHTIRVFKSNRKLLSLNTIEIPTDIAKAIHADAAAKLQSMKPNFKKLRNPQNIMNVLGLNETGSFFDQFENL